MSKKVKNTSDLREMLLDTINGVRSGKIDPRQAQAISTLSCRILQSAKLDLEVAKLSGSVTPAVPAASLVKTNGRSAALPN